MEDFYYWYLCPICNKKLIKIYENTQIYNLKVKCKKCKNEISIIVNPIEAK